MLKPVSLRASYRWPRYGQNTFVRVPLVPGFGHTHTIAGTVLRRYMTSGAVVIEQGYYWSKEEDDKLLSLRRQGMRNKEISTSFPSRSEIAVKFRLNTLIGKNQDIGRRRYYRSITVADEERIRALHAKGMNANETSRRTGRSLSTVRDYLKRSGLRSHPSTPQRNGWSSREVKLLQPFVDGSRTIKPMELEKMFPDRTSDSIKAKLQALRRAAKITLNSARHGWTKKQEIELLQLCKPAADGGEGMRIKDIADELGRSIENVYRRLRKLCGDTKTARGI